MARATETREQPERTRPSRQLDRETLGDYFDRLSRAARRLSGSREEAENLVQGTYADRDARATAHRDDALGDRFSPIPVAAVHDPRHVLGRQTHSDRVAERRAAARDQRALASDSTFEPSA
jgi:hypothetical protein